MLIATKPDLPELLRQYRLACNTGDMPSAIVLHDRIADDLYRQVTAARSPNLALPSIVSSFQPKSGGTFLFNRLIHGFGYRHFAWGPSHTYFKIITCFAARPLTLYLGGGCAQHSHFLPTAWNLSQIDNAGVRMLWIHVRDPAAATVSGYYYLLGDGQPDVARTAIEQQKARAGISLTGLPGEIDEFFRNRLPSAIDWIDQWRRVAAARPGFVFFTFYPELASPACLFNRVFAAFAVPLDATAEPIVSRTARDRPGTDFRPDWRVSLTSDSVDFAQQEIARRLGDWEHWQALMEGAKQ